MQSPINTGQKSPGGNQFHKILDRIDDGTRTTENFSKLCENCRLLKEEFDSEIFSLKDKAHQSFMQVIQVQQLHEEEVELLKQEHEETVTRISQQSEERCQQIEKYKEQLEVMEKNSKHQYCDKFEADEPSFLIDNIEIIECQNEEKLDRLDESSYMQFNDIVEEPLKRTQDPKVLQSEALSKNRSKEDLVKQLAKSYLENEEVKRQLQNLKGKIQKLQSLVSSLMEENSQLKQSVATHANNSKVIKNNYQALYKESKFMSDHIRNISAEKFRLEKTIKEYDKQLKKLKTVGTLSKSTHFGEPNNSELLYSSTLEIPGHQKESGFDNKSGYESLRELGAEREQTADRKAVNMMTKSDTFGIAGTQQLNQDRTKSPKPHSKYGKFMKKGSYDPSEANRKKMDLSNKMHKSREKPISQHSEHPFSSQLVVDESVDLPRNSLKSNRPSIGFVSGVDDNGKKLFKQGFKKRTVSHWEGTTTS